MTTSNVSPRSLVREYGAIPVTELGGGSVRKAQFRIPGRIFGINNVFVVGLKDGGSTGHGDAIPQMRIQACRGKMQNGGLRGVSARKVIIRA